MSTVRLEAVKTGMDQVARTEGGGAPGREIPMQPASTDIWDKKYRLKTKAGEAIDADIDGTYQRVGVGASSFAGRQQFNGTANVVYEFGHTRTTRVVPYVIGGAGVYSFQGHFDSSSTRFGLNAGAGVNLNFGPGLLFLESRFHNVFRAGLGSDGSTASAQLIPITAGFKFTGP